VTLTETLESGGCSGQSEDIIITALPTANTFENKQTELINGRIARDMEAQSLYEVREALEIKQQQYDAALREDPNALDLATQSVQSEIESLEDDAEYQWKKYFIKFEHAKNLQRGWLTQGTASYISNLDDAYPIALFPVRLETKFKTHGNSYKLKVRVYPDDVAVESHEPELTGVEISLGANYWVEVNGTNNNNEKRAAWNALATQLSPQRAAWVSLKTDPTLPVEEQVAQKSTDWTRQPEIRILPDRFVVRLYQASVAGGDYAQVGTFETNLISDRLKIGIDPKDEESLKADGTENDNVIKLGGEAAWIQDFDAAIEAGMALEIEMNQLTAPLTKAQVDSSYFKLVVVGAKVSESPSRSKDMLEANFENHHYVGEGMKLLKIKTPTSNTSVVSTPHRKPDLGSVKSFGVERVGPLFPILNNYLSKRDGQRLAEALGIDNVILQHIAGSGNIDITKALINNGVFSASTIGSKMKDLWGNIFDVNDIDNTRDFFSKHVVSRGILPTIQVDSQPYGMMPVSSFKDWTWDAVEEADEYPFLEELRGTLDTVSNIIDGVVSSASTLSDTAASAQEALLRTLSQQPVSINLRGRIAYGPDLVYNSLSFRQKLETANNWYSTLETEASTKAQALGLSSENLPKALLLSQESAAGRVNKALVEELRLSDTEPLAPMSGLSINYLEWLSSATFAQIKNKEIEAESPIPDQPPVLLFEASRDSIMHEYWFAAYKLAKDNGVENLPWSTPDIMGAPEAGEELPEGLTQNDLLTSAQDPWDLMDLIVEELDSNKTLAEFLDSTVSDSFDAKVNLQETKSNLYELSNLPSADVDILFRETMDASSYRLDGWQLGLVNYRLEKMRNGVGGNRFGTYLGAYGYIEDLKPDTERTMLTQNELNEIEGIEGEIERIKDAKGFIHAPSMRHATAAAVLKSAYDPIKDKQWGNDAGYPRRINLNSGRVRQALKFIEGMNGGQDLGGLLGYQFERQMQESTLNLNQYIYIFRRAFPTAQITDHDDEPIENLGASNVTDGLVMYNTVNELLLSEEVYPYQIMGGLPGIESAEGTAINDIILSLGEVIDAIHDVAVSESMYHLVQGKFESAASVMEAFEKGEPLPVDLEVLKSVRDSSVFNQKLCIQMDVSSAQNNIWGPTPSYKATAEPTLNSWLNSQFPAPTNVLAEVKINGFDMSGNAVSLNENIALELLDLEPIDFVYLDAAPAVNNESALSTLIRYKLRLAHNLSAESNIEIVYDNYLNDGLPAGDYLTFYQIVAYVDNLKQTINSSRYLKPDDYLFESEIDQSSQVSRF
jgi:hypothetical protein